MNSPRIKIQSQVKYHGSFLAVALGAMTDALALDDAELLIIIGVSLSPESRSTCLPHLGHTTHSESIISPQCLQYFVFVSILFSSLCVFIKKPMAILTLILSILFHIPEVLTIVLQYNPNVQVLYRRQLANVQQTNLPLAHTGNYSKKFLNP